jgi:hypothetical protein
MDPGSGILLFLPYIFTFDSSPQFNVIDLILPSPEGGAGGG